MTGSGDGSADLARVQAELDARIPSRIVPGLERIRYLLHLLGDPQRAYPSIHIAGTNGKTSTARMVDALLVAFGLRTGRTTSPHLASVTERIAVDGVPLDGASFAAAYDDIAPLVSLTDERHPDRVTYYELLTAMAFAHFADRPVDVAVVEVGLGGRWDATNVLDAPVAVITPIGLDHQEYLGDTLAAIATEKAAIVAEHAALVSGVQDAAAADVLFQRAAQVGAQLLREGIEFGILQRAVAVGGQQIALRGITGDYDDIWLPLHGAHQASNAACALAAVEAFLGGQGARGVLDPALVRAGFAGVASPGRLEVLRTSPTILVDAAHNPAGARATATALSESFGFTRLVGVVAILADKDAAGILAELEPLFAEVVITTNASPRAFAADDLAGIAVDIFGGDRVLVEPQLPDAVEAAVEIAEADGLGGAGVLITGSIVTVAEARALLGTR
ncbi:MAG: folylpolyglutamate synthase/dihydrofolate synthase family protein [Frankiaceae bacterium]